MYDFGDIAESGIDMRQAVVLLEVDLSRPHAVLAN